MLFVAVEGEMVDDTDQGISGQRRLPVLINSPQTQMHSMLGLMHCAVCPLNKTTISPSHHTNSSKTCKPWPRVHRKCSATILFTTATQTKSIK